MKSKNDLFNSLPFLAAALVTLSFMQYGCQGHASPGPDPDNTGIPGTPHIDYVEMLPVQPEENDENVIWYDDFDTEKSYMGYKGKIDHSANYGVSGGSVNMGFDKGDVTGRGNRQVAFGDFPGGSPVVSEGKKFGEVYWRIYVKHEHGWEGAPAKMSRATSIVSENWRQAMIMHVWSGSGNSLTLDPASGVMDMTDSVITTKYNDFDNLRWLGNRPESHFRISATDQSGYWVPVEARAKLNTPGESDGLAQLWINGKLEAERKNLNFRGTFTAYGINAVFLESYWNNGAVKTENRWFDNFVVSTQPIGPVSCPENPAVHKTPWYNSGIQERWELEMAADSAGNDIVYHSVITGEDNSTTVNVENGEFSGSMTGQSSLKKGIYFCRVRQKGEGSEWSDWSEWHQPVRIW